MPLCLNPHCFRPENPEGVNRCRACGAGLLLRQRYRAIATIGQGGFGRTFLAVDEAQPGRPQCVIKQFLPLHQGPRHLKKAVELFEQEARRLEELGDHPQIPALLAHFSQEQQQYLIQEFVAGPTLAEILEQRGAFNEEQIRSLLASLLPVLKFIHARNVIHRDIKPANIIATAPPPPPDKPAAIEWNRLLQALAQEAAQGCRNSAGQGHPIAFNQWLSGKLRQLPTHWAIADYRRCQDLAEQFSHYALLTASQRQYVVADASRLLYEMRQRYERGEPIAASAAAIPDLTSELTLVLVDFGAAKSVQGSLTQTGTAIGSPEYQAPEQARGKAVFASDLYSLGVTCLHLLTRTSPLDLFDPHESVWQWRHHLKHPVSPELGRLLDKLVEPGLRRRFPSAIAVLQTLQPQPTRRRTAKKRPVWQCLHTLPHAGKVNAIALSPVAPLLASSSGTTIKLWQLDTGQPISTLVGHLDLVSALVITPDGKLLISGSADKTTRIWELASGKRLGSLGLHTDTVLALALSPNGTTLASSSLYDPIVLLDLAAGQADDRLYGHDLRIEALAFSPDGKLLASGSADRSIKLWHSAGELRTLTGHTAAIAALRFSPDGQTLISAAADGTVRFWSTKVRRQKKVLEVDSERVNAIALSPDGKLLATGGTTLKLWPTRSSKEPVPLPGHLGPVSAIAFADNHTLVSSSWDGTVRVWKLTTQR